MMSIGMVSGQGINQKKMDKDLEVAKNVLGSMLDKSSGVRFFPRNNSIEAKYTDGEGVVFIVNNRFSALGGSGQLAIAYTEASRQARGSGVSIVGGRTKSDSQEASAPEAVIIEEDDAKKQQLSEVFRDFIKDYGTLIRQLKSSDKIIVKTSNRRRGFGNYVVAGYSSIRSVNSISVEAIKSDLDAYESGKLSEDQINDKIIVRESSTDLEKEPEIEVFSSVLGRLYQSDLSETYYMNGSPFYERTEGMGLTYYLKFYSSMSNDGGFFLPTIQKNAADLEERNKTVNDMYPKFLEGFKSSILDYGHLLKNLEDNETVTFNIELTECEGCDMPEEIDVSVKKSVIDQYRKDQLSLNQAMDKVKVTIVK